MRHDYTASGTITVEINRDSDGWFVPARNGYEAIRLPASVSAEIDSVRRTNWDFWEELEIHIRAKGYYDPGKTYGPPEDCYPPEGSEERTVSRIDLIKSRRQKDWMLSEESRAALEELLNSDIEAANLESDEPEPWPV